MIADRAGFAGLADSEAFIRFLASQEAATRSLIPYLKWVLLLGLVITVMLGIAFAPPWVDWAWGDKALIFWSKQGVGVFALVAALPLLRATISYQPAKWGVVWGLASLFLLLPIYRVFQQLTAVPFEEVMEDIFHFQGWYCLVLAWAFSWPVFCLLMFYLKRLLPLLPVRSGAFVGLLAAGCGVVVYSLSCDEMGASFILFWYGAALIVGTGLGALCGRWFLRN